MVKIIQTSIKLKFFKRIIKNIRKINHSNITIMIKSRNLTNILKIIKIKKNLIIILPKIDYSDHLIWIWKQTHFQNMLNNIRKFKDSVCKGQEC
jgi:hypothetical protein